MEAKRKIIRFENLIRLAKIHVPGRGDLPGHQAGRVCEGLGTQGPGLGTAFCNPFIINFLPPIGVLSYNAEDPGEGVFEYHIYTASGWGGISFPGRREGR